MSLGSTVLGSGRHRPDDRRHDRRAGSRDRDDHDPGGGLRSADADRQRTRRHRRSRSRSWWPSRSSRSKTTSFGSVNRLLSFGGRNVDYTMRVHRGRRLRAGRRGHDLRRAPRADDGGARGRRRRTADGAAPAAVARHPPDDRGVRGRGLPRLADLAVARAGALIRSTITWRASFPAEARPVVSATADHASPARRTVNA